MNEGAGVEAGKFQGKLLYFLVFQYSSECYFVSLKCSFNTRFFFGYC